MKFTLLLLLGMIFAILFHFLDITVNKDYFGGVATTTNIFFIMFGKQIFNNNINGEQEDGR